MRLQELGGRVDSHKGSDKTTKRLWQHVKLKLKENEKKRFYMLDWAKICPTSKQRERAEL